MSAFEDAINSYSGLANGLLGMYGGLQGASNANRINSGVQGGINSATTNTQAQIDALTNQIAQSRQQAQDMYQRSLGDVTSQNSGLQGNIDTLTGNLNALSDPNSAYMQQARQAIERKDAAAGRNSQWGDREVQLAATLADYVGKYAPGLQSSITGARNQIATNNSGLANLFNTANQVGDRESLAQLTALQQQLANAQAANTTGRQAANSATNNTVGALQSGVGALGSLAQLFGGNTMSPGTISSFWGNQGSVDNGITGYGGLLGNSYGVGGAGSIYDNNAGGGYGALPAGDYFGGGGLGGTPMGGGYGLGYTDTPNNIDDWNFWS